MANQNLVKRQPFRNKVAVVCGGSKGIGRETAKEIVLLGGSVCVIGRGLESLESAVFEIRGLLRWDTQFVELIKCDATDMDRMKPALNEFIARKGTPDFLINLVGYAYPQYIQNLTLNDFRNSMETNYFGQLVPTLILLPHFKAARKGHIANVSSIMGFFGIMGYAAYAPAKYAIVGLTEALRHELKPCNVTFSVLYPPDTETPGYETENRTKPKECTLMAESMKPLKANKVAEIFVEGILKKRLAIMPGEAGMLWRISRFFPWLLRWIIDRQYHQAKRKLGSVD